MKKGTSDKVAQGISGVATFLVGFTIGFVYGWEMAALLLGAAPLMGGTR